MCNDALTDLERTSPHHKHVGAGGELDRSGLIKFVSRFWLCLFAWEGLYCHLCMVKCSSCADPASVTRLAPQQIASTVTSKVPPPAYLILLIWFLPGLRLLPPTYSFCLRGRRYTNHNPDAESIHSACTCCGKGITLPRLDSWLVV